MLMTGVMERCCAIDEEYYLGDYYDYDYEDKSISNTGKDGSELSSDDYSYLYYEEYYEELVPEHHRFLELADRSTTSTTTTTAPTPSKRKPKSQRRKKKK